MVRVYNKILSCLINSSHCICALCNTVPVENETNLMLSMNPFDIKVFLKEVRGELDCFDSLYFTRGCILFILFQYFNNTEFDRRKSASGDRTRTAYIKVKWNC